MAATGIGVARRWFRRRAVAMVPFIVLVVIGTTGTLVALGAADDTVNAYGRVHRTGRCRLPRAQPDDQTTEVEEIIASSPGVGG